MTYGHRKRAQPKPRKSGSSLAVRLASRKKTAAAMLSRLSYARASLLDAFDQLHIPTLLLTTHGVELARTMSADRTLAAASDSASLLKVVKQLAIQLGKGEAARSPRSDTRNERNGARDYAIQARLIDRDVLCSEPVVLVLIEPTAPSLPDVAALKSVFGLTSREASVAVLLVDGASNRVIAERLKIRASTVRTHVERVFSKLGMHSRKALGLALMHSIAGQAVGVPRVSRSKGLA